jgi:hypothetical protein
MGPALLAVGLALAALAPVPSRADVGPPAHLRVSERERGLFVAQWRVPKALPPRAVPVPHLPESCEPVGRYSVEEPAGAWLFTQEYRCEAGIAGEIVGLRFPFPDLALSTVIRVDLLSGDRFAHLLAPGEKPWRLPEGTAMPDRLREGARAVALGALHVFTTWAHLPFLLVVGLLGGVRRAVGVVTAFTAGQLMGMVAAVWGPGTGAVPPEIAIGITSALLAREALRPAAVQRRTHALSVAGGIVHGLAMGSLVSGGLGAETAGLLLQLLAVLGLDAGHLGGAVAVAVLSSMVMRSRLVRAAGAGMVYASGTAGIALALGLAVGGGVVEPAAEQLGIPAVDPPRAGRGAASPGSRRVAPSAPDAPVQSFLVVEPFEVRHEVLIRLAGLAPTLGLDPASILEIGDQAMLAERLTAFVLDGASVHVDGSLLSGVPRRADFMTVDSTGALPRAMPVPEPVSEAVVGVVIAYPTSGMAREASLSWEPFPSTPDTVPATVIDPESVTVRVLSAAEPLLRWTNKLAEDPIPAVEAVAVEPLRLPMPLLSLPLLVTAIILVLLAGLRRRRAAVSVAGARMALALALLVAPVAQPTFALPGSPVGRPSERQARRILGGLLPNVYRAMEFREEGLIYDRLAVSVTGDTLTEVYLEQRRTLEMEERGGAQARIEAVEILEASEIAALAGGFRVRAVWTASGMVTHFGHRHFRQNRYDARIAVVPAEGTWKIRSVEMLDQERLR